MRSVCARLSLPLLPLSASLNRSLVANSRSKRTVRSPGQVAYPLAVSSSQSKAHQKAGTETRNAGELKLRGSVIQLTHPYVRLYMCPDSTAYASASLGIIRFLPGRYIHKHNQLVHTCSTSGLGAAPTHMRAHARKLVGWAYLRYLRRMWHAVPEIR